MKADLSCKSKNPEEKLEELRRLSLLEFEHLKSPEHPTPPLRELPAHSVPKRETSGHHTGAGSPRRSVKTDGAKDGEGVAEEEKEAPIFRELQFGGDGSADGEGGSGLEKDDLLSPTEKE